MGEKKIENEREKDTRQGRTEPPSSNGTERPGKETPLPEEGEVEEFFYEFDRKMDDLFGGEETGVGKRASEPPHLENQEERNTGEDLELKLDDFFNETDSGDEKKPAASPQPQATPPAPESGDDDRDALELKLDDLFGETGGSGAEKAPAAPRRQAKAPVAESDADDGDTLELKLDDLFGETGGSGAEKAPAAPRRQAKAPAAESDADDRDAFDLKMDDLFGETEVSDSPKKPTDGAGRAVGAATQKPPIDRQVADTVSGAEKKAPLPKRQKTKEKKAATRPPARPESKPPVKKDPTQKEPKRRAKGKIQDTTVTKKNGLPDAKDVHEYAMTVALGKRKKKSRRGLYITCGIASLLLAGAVLFFTPGHVRVPGPGSVEKKPVARKTPPHESEAAPKPVSSEKRYAKKGISSPKPQPLKAGPPPPAFPERHSLPSGSRPSQAPPPLPQPIARASGPGGDAPTPVKQPAAEKKAALPVKNSALSSKKTVSPGGVPPKRYPYTIHLASYHSLETARENMVSLREAAFEPYLVRFDLGKIGIWYRLFVGNFKTSDAARQTIREKGIKDAVPYNAVYAAFVGAYASREDADAEIRRLSEKGYYPYWIDGKNTRHNLYLGAFKTRKEATAFTEELESAGIRAQVAER